MSVRPSPVFHGRISNGKIEIDRAADFAKLRSRLEGSEVDIILRKHRKPRSLKQNGYYWAVVIPLMAEAAGYDEEEMHEALKWRFLQCRTEGAMPTVRSTSDLDTGEFTIYIEQCRQLAAEFYGINVPDPGEAE